MDDPVYAQSGRDSASGGSLNPFDDLEDDEEILTMGVGEEGGKSDLIPTHHQRDYRDLPLHERPPNYQLRHHWNEMDGLIQSGSMDPFALEELREHFRVMEKLLIKDRPEQAGQIGPCLKLVLNENIVENFYMFSTQQRVYAKELRIMLLRFFTEVLARASQPLLIHQQILRPISKLLRACEASEDREINSALVPFLHQLCILMQENQSLLDLFFEAKPNMKSKFLIFIELIPHMHSMGEVGNRARDAILLCLSLAAQLPGSNLSHFIAVESNFCQVLATGLSGLYSELPSSREIAVDDWQSPIPVIEVAVPELRRSTQALNFCNSVLQMAPKVVRDTVLSLVREGFLQQVMGPALLQKSEEAVTFATGYLTIFLSHITNIQLMREFLFYLTVGQCDGKSILNYLINNISSTSVKLCAVTLELFHKLVDLNCEDLMLELVLRHLLPGQHIMPNQLAIIGAPDLYSQAARKLLQLIPTSCINAEKMFLNSIRPQPTNPSTDSATPTDMTANRDASSPPPPPLLTSSPTPQFNHLERPTAIRSSSPLKTGSTTHSGGTGGHGSSTNPFNHQPLSRSRSGSDASTSSLVSMSSASSAPHSGSHMTGGMPTMSSSGTTAAHSHMPAFPPRGMGGREREKKVDSTGGPAFEFDYITPEVAYLRNLHAAREAILECANRCRCWSNEYSKCKLTKESFEAEETRTVGIGTKSLEMEDVSVRVRVTSEDGSEMDGKKQEEEDFSRFRNRSTTLSGHSRVTRTSSVRVTNRQRLERSTLQDRVVAKNENDPSSSSSLAADLSHLDSPDHLSSNSYSPSLRRRGTVSSSSPRTSPRSSPRLGRKFANSPLQFEDKAGLFLKVLAEKLAEMLKHPPAVNILLTQVICRLAQYPQPLIRSFLLNHQLVLRPGVPNLLYVIQSIKTTVDGYMRTQDGFEKRLGRARKTMIYRAKVRNSQIEESVAQQIVSRLLRQSSVISEAALDAVSNHPDGGHSPPRKRASQAKLALSSSQDEQSAKSKVTAEGSKSLIKKPRKKKVSTDTLFAIVIFDEFLRELAALAQEHSVTNPVMNLPKASLPA